MIDEEDSELVSGANWEAVQGSRNRYPYAYGFINGKQVSMHRLIMNAQQGQMVDHINGNGLDNRRSNLRFCTAFQNQHNAQKSIRRKSSTFKGVYLSNNKYWYSQIMVNRKYIYIGSFKTEIEAALAYNKAVTELNGEFERLNYIDPKDEKEYFNKAISDIDAKIKMLQDERDVRTSVAVPKRRE